MDGKRPNEAEARLKRRLSVLRQHHNKCEAHLDYVNHNSRMETRGCSKKDINSDQAPILNEDILCLQQMCKKRMLMEKKELHGHTSDSSISSAENSEEEYIPDTTESEENESIPSPKKGKIDTSHTKNITSIDKETIDKDTPNSDGDGSEVSVMKLNKTEQGRRKYNKKQYCLYCYKSFCKMARHLERIHKNELEVAKALSFNKGSKERRIQLDLLRNKGNRVHNMNVLKTGKGVLVPRQQTTAKNTSVKDYMHCVNCQGLFKRKALWRHMSRCNLAKKCSTKPGKSRVQALCAYAQPVPDCINKKLWKLISDMNQDEVTLTVKSDKCILKFGEHLYNKMGSDKTKHEYIRQKMREAARLLFHARKTGNLQRIEDFFCPSNFNHVIQAVKDTCGFKEEEHAFEVPSLALKLGHSLKKMADIVECEAIISKEDDIVQNVNKFKHLYGSKWNESVSACALKTLHESKWNRPELLPFTEDVKKMHLHLDEKRKDYQNKIQLEKNQKNWSNLAKVTLCEVILFNRRRAGEVSKMRLNSYVLRDTSDLHSDVADALSEVEKKLCEHFQRIEIRGKRDRKVPILLTPEMLTSMELLVKNRQTCGVTDENQFMFARPGAETYFRGSDCIRIFASECGATHPKSLSSTKLRKHVSTLSKVLNLKDTEMDQLADFLGHDIRVHRKFYRLPEGTLQLAKISKVLMALEQGRIAEFKGRNLEDINIEPNEKVNMDSDLSETDGEDEAEEEELLAVSDQPEDQDQRKKKKASSVSKDNVPAASDKSKNQVSREELLAVSDQPEDQDQRKKKKASSVSKDNVPAASDKSKNQVSREELLAVSDQPEDQDQRNSCCASSVSKGSSTTQRKKWSPREIKAVEDKFIDWIATGKVPGKKDCMDCLRAAPAALKSRTWEAIKFYVKNRITSYRRECEKRK